METIKIAMIILIINKKVIKIQLPIIYGQLKKKIKCLLLKRVTLYKELLY